MSNDDRLPAKRRVNAVTVSPPTISSGGPLQALGTRFQADRDAKTLDALTRKTQSFTAYIDSRTQLVEKQSQHVRALTAHQELPEILGHEVAVRRVERIEIYRQVQHSHEMGEKRRKTELTCADVALTDAEQQLKAQREHGSKTYDLKWKKQDYETLNLEMSAREKRAALRDKPKDDGIDEALYAQRDELNAYGLDTTKVDDLIERRKRQ